MSTTDDQEIEVKFLIRDLPRLEALLREQGAELETERVFEANLRFDTPARELTRARRVLRLRQDQRARLTFKGPAQSGSEVNSRQEIEFEVGDFGAARRLLKALGYEVSAMYEKYRATYRLGELEVVLDELPYGNFAEIEGPGAGAIKIAADRLGLRWEARIADSYLGLFERYCTAKNLRLVELSFEAFKNLEIKPADLELSYADPS
jgi:adenylate cyclase class 2